MLLLLSHFSHVQLCVTPWTAAHQAPPSLGFSRQKHWSGLPFPSPMHESEKWKGSRSVVYDPQRPHGLQPTRLLRPWDFLGKSTGVGCHCLLRVWSINLWWWFQPRLLAQRCACATVGTSATLAPAFLKQRNEALCKTAFKLHKWLWATELHVAISYEKVIGISRNQTNIVLWFMSFLIFLSSRYRLLAFSLTAIKKLYL